MLLRLPRWALLPLIFCLARGLSILGLYTLATPNGGTVVPKRLSFATVAGLSELGALLILSLIYWVCLRRFSARSRTVFAWSLAVFGLYALFAQIDAEIRRWMGLRLNLVFLRRLEAGGLEAGFWHFLLRSLTQDPAGTAWGLACGLLPTAVAAFVAHPPRAPAPPAVAPAGVLPGRWTLAACLANAGSSIGLSFWFQPAVRKWRLAAPAAYGLAMDLGRTLVGADLPQNPERARKDLANEFGSPDPDPEYPLWHAVPDEARRYAEFRARPLERRPDVVLVIFESLRGWFLDWRDPAIASLAPNLHRLWRERGLAFTRAHSNGFPSGEGNMSLQMGIVSHPARAIFAEYQAIRSLSLPEILGRAGYARYWFTATDPSFDNMLPWVRRWYDETTRCPQDDAALVDAALARWDQVARDQPRLLTLYTGSTHNPFRVPESEGPPLDDKHAAYLRAVRYADRALGKLFDHLRASGRWDQTIVVVMGDHAQPNRWQLEHEDETGLVHPGRTWTGLLVAAPGLGPAGIRDDSVSQIDVPPTVLGLLGLSVSNHFMGRDLTGAANSRRRVLSLIYGGIGIYRDGEELSAEVDDAASIRKHRYDPGSPRDPTRYELGENLPVSDDDREELGRAVDMLRLYGNLIDHDRLRPPDQVSTGEPGNR